ncbi:MAG: ribosome maturation factor RimM [Pseudomonadota bacterium]
MSMEQKVCLGVFGAPHGVRGAVRVKTFTATPEDVAAYGPVTLENGSRTFTLKVLRTVKPGLVLITAPEIKNRDDAASLTNQKIFIDRDALPEPDDADEFYMEDLIGLNCVLADGTQAGRVAAMHNFGAGDLLEVKPAAPQKGEKARLIPFTKALVPEINLAGGRITLASEAFLDDDVTQADEQAAREKLKEEDVEQS